jgi:hypothetical protein
MATGDASGSWGTNTNTNLTLIGEAFGYATKAIADASTATLTIPDGTETDSEPRRMYLKLTGGGQACTVTLAPNTASKVWIIENVTSYTLTFTQGSGANVDILAGETKMIATDGAGSGAVVYDVLTDLNLAGTTKTAALTNAGALSNQGTVTVGVDDTGYDVKLFGATSGAYMLWDESADDLKLVGAAGLTVAGDADIDGTTNLDAVDIDGAVQADGTITVGVDDTGYDVKFFGATASAYMLWDESADDLILAGAARVVVPASGLVIASTAVSSTAAELNLLDGLDRGSILYGNASSATTVLGQGSADQVLTSDGTDISWEDASGGATDLDGLTDCVSGIANFTNSLILGHQTTGTLDSADGNTGVGYAAMDAITSGDNNVAVGYNSLSVLTTGSKNVAVGAHALSANTTAVNNVAVGYGALNANSTGQYNTAVGYYALTANSTGSQNTAFGQTALGVNTTASNNTALGYNTLASNTTGAYNIAVGPFALDANTTADNNTAVGSNALGVNTTGIENVAVGNYTLDANTTGTHNTAVGYNVLSANTSAVNNVGIGAQAMSSTTGGAYNTAVGNDALKTATTGAYNVAIGQSALNKKTTSASNTAIGSLAGEVVTTGANNLFLGFEAGKTGSPGGAITTASNEVCIGDENISAANIQVDWTIASDKRDKTDVNQLDLGLDFINQLEPVTYRWDKRSKYSNDQSITPDGTHKEEQLEGGFLAQDVEVIEAQYGYQQSDKTNLITNLSEDGMMYGIKYSKLVPMLTKAIQELSAKVEALEKE